jgi:hypothetical protein
VGPRACLDNLEKRKFLALPRLELRPFGRPARSQSLYRLRYPGYEKGHMCQLIIISDMQGQQNIWLVAQFIYESAQ